MGCPVFINVITFFVCLCVNNKASYGGERKPSIFTSIILAVLDVLVLVQICLQWVAAQTGLARLKAQYPSQIKNVPQATGIISAVCACIVPFLFVEVAVFKARRERYGSNGPRKITEDPGCAKQRRFYSYTLLLFVLVWCATLPGLQADLPEGRYRNLDGGEKYGESLFQLAMSNLAAMHTVVTIFGWMVLYIGLYYFFKALCCTMHEMRELTGKRKKYRSWAASGAPPSYAEGDPDRINLDVELQPPPYAIVASRSNEDLCSTGSIEMDEFGSDTNETAPSPNEAWFGGVADQPRNPGVS